MLFSILITYLNYEKAESLVKKELEAKSEDKAALISKFPSYWCT